MPSDEFMFSFVILIALSLLKFYFIIIHIYYQLITVLKYLFTNQMMTLMIFFYFFKTIFKYFFKYVFYIFSCDSDKISQPSNVSGTTSK